MRAIRNQLIQKAGAGGKLVQCFDSWDVVSLYPLDARNFPTSPAIENYGNAQNGTPNRHGIVGYHGDGTVAKKIIQHLL